MPIPPCKAASLRPLESGPRRFSASSLGGRYSGVVLDRLFRLSAEPAGDPLYRDAALLSAGTADQLYLATRLAICDLVLPADRAVPIVLDDALANLTTSAARLPCAGSGRKLSAARFFSSPATAGRRNFLQATLGSVFSG